MEDKRLKRIIKEALDSVINEKTYNVPLTLHDLGELVSLYRAGMNVSAQDIERCKRFGRDYKMYEELLEERKYKFEKYNNLYQQLRNQS